MFLRYLTAGVAIVGAGLIAPASTPPAPPDVQVRTVQLTGGEDSLGDGPGLIVGASGISTPGQAYVDAAMEKFLGPLGFTGPTQVVTTPEGLYPFLGPFGEMYDPSVRQGAQSLVDAVDSHLGGVTSGNPVVVFGYSQGADVETSAMQQLHADGVPSDDLRFVMIGDPQNPDGGLLERYNLPGAPHDTIPSLGITFSGATPDDYYPTDIYTHEYDGFADAPRYPIDFLSDLNATLGIALEHTTYLGLTSTQLQEAIQLPTSGGMTDYFMLPTHTLPLLAPFELLPFVGKPLVDLLQPDLSVLVNLGYGNTIDSYLGGWDQGVDANDPTPLGFLPDASVLEQIPQALLNGLETGITDAFKDLISPSNYGYSLPSWADELIRSAGAITGSQLSVLHPVPTTLHDLFGIFPPHTGAPQIDVASALLFTLPELDYHEVAYELAQGHPLDAIGIPAAADLGILPLALVGAVL